MCISHNIVTCARMAETAERAGPSCVVRPARSSNLKGFVPFSSGTACTKLTCFTYTCTVLEYKYTLQNNVYMYVRYKISIHNMVIVQGFHYTVPKGCASYLKR